jgi:hypothetical protein
MRIGFTINLGNYESLRIDSSDLPTIKMCLTEIKELLSVFEHIPEVRKFIDKLGVEGR